MTAESDVVATTKSDVWHHVHHHSFRVRIFAAIRSHRHHPSNLEKTRNCEAPKIQGAKKTDQIIVVLFVAGNVAYEQKRHNKKQIKIPAK